MRVGRYGPFLEQGDRRASIPEQMPPDELTLDAALKMLETSTQNEAPLGHAPDGKPVFLKVGRFGPYVQHGEAGDDEKPKNASLLKGMQPEDVTIEVALKLLSLPRTLGQHPQSGQPVMAHNGPYGPYVKCEKEIRSLPAGLSPLDVTFEQAVELLAQPKTGGRGRGAVKREPLKVFATSPVTNNPVQLLAGRYGPYVTDGVTNASLPRGTAPEEVTLEYALNLLKARAEQGPAKRPVRARRGRPSVQRRRQRRRRRRRRKRERKKQG